jgi:hypothetical protein
MDATAPSESVLPERDTCYRLRRKYLLVGVVAVTGCVVMGTTSTAAAWWNLDGSFPRPKLAAAIFAAFWSCFSLLGWWLILASIRFRLFVSNLGIEEQGVIWTTAIPFDQVTRLDWRLGPQRGSAKIHSSEAKITLHFDNFTPSERLELIAAIRERVKVSLQHGWDEFDERFFHPPSPARLRQVKVLNAILVAMLGFFAVFFTWCWWIGGGPEHLALGIVNAGAALAYLRLTAFRSGKTSTPLS